MHAPVKFHNYIPYGLGVMAQIMFTIWTKSRIDNSKTKKALSSLFITHHHNVMHAPEKFHKYIPYGLGVMAWTQFTIWN